MFAGPSIGFLADKRPLHASDVELWEMKLTGDTVGVFKLQLKRVKTEKGFHNISGKFSGTMNDRTFGQGKMTMKLKGKIENDALRAKLSGSASVSDGHVSLRGTMKGTLSETQGFGTWSMTHDWGSPKGEWTMKRINPPPQNRPSIQ